MKIKHDYKGQVVKIQKRNSKKDKATFSILTFKLLLILVFLLILIPCSFVVYSTQFRGKIKVGLVLTDDDLVGYGETAKDSLNDFHGVFSAKVLETRFNESKVRVQDGSYLTDDYFDADFARSTKRNHDVEIILIITDKLINNWQGDRLARWGQAETKTGMALITVSTILNGTNSSSVYMVSVARHEILHLLGYGHPDSSRKCLMRYASTDTEVCDEYEIVLPYYAALWKIGYGHDPGGAVFLIRASFLLLLSPIFIAAIITFHFLFKRYIYKKEAIASDPLIFGLGALYVALVLGAAFIMPFYPQIAAMSAGAFFYLIIESIHHEKTSKQLEKVKNGRKPKEEFKGND